MTSSCRSSDSERQLIAADCRSSDSERQLMRATRASDEIASDERASGKGDSTESSRASQVQLDPYWTTYGSSLPCPKRHDTVTIFYSLEFRCRWYIDQCRRLHDSITISNRCSLYVQTTSSVVQCRRVYVDETRRQRVRLGFRLAFGSLVNTRDNREGAWKVISSHATRRGSRIGTGTELTVYLHTWTGLVLFKQLPMYCSAHQLRAHERVRQPEYVR